MTTGLDLTTTNKLERAFRPRSVAVLGASNDPLRISGRPLYYMKKAGYQGTIYPVNNKRDSVQEIRAYPSLASLPEAPDIALICLPKEAVKDAVRECVDKGVAAAVIFAAGFAETGPAGKTCKTKLPPSRARAAYRCLGPTVWVYSTPVRALWGPLPVRSMKALCATDLSPSSAKAALTVATLPISARHATWELAIGSPPAMKP